ncbi:MAG: formate dehydrogenase accessory sulfurtransferase FdhD [Pseudomonadota bacterium]|nr:formate dehydrogenase accessory sulfurtransferase FdhD [Pseudomonadota bacterium]
MPDIQTTDAVAPLPAAGTAPAGTAACSYYSAAAHRADSTLLIEETPLTISCNGVTHAVMMVSPLDIRDFVTGFALSEDLIRSVADIRSLSISESGHPLHHLLADIQLQPECFKRFLKQQRSARRGASGCGLCGSESLQQVLPDITPLSGGSPPDYPALQHLRDRLRDFQQLGQQAGAVHAALLLDAELQPLLCREDIGRHNALDKVIGAALQQNIDLSQCAVLMSSRCSTELVIKAARSGLPQLLHLSSPSTLAVELARHYGVGLIHIPRSDSARIYCSAGDNDLTGQKATCL